MSALLVWFRLRVGEAAKGVWLNYSSEPRDPELGNHKQRTRIYVLGWFLIRVSSVPGQSPSEVCPDSIICRVKAWELRQCQDQPPRLETALGLVPFLPSPFVKRAIDAHSSLVMHLGILWWKPQRECSGFCCYCCYYLIALGTFEADNYKMAEMWQEIKILKLNFQLVNKQLKHSVFCCLSGI